MMAVSVALQKDIGAKNRTLVLHCISYLQRYDENYIIRHGLSVLSILSEGGQ